MILDSLLAGVMLFGSYAIRTPNEQPNPDDYEVSVGLNSEVLSCQSSMGTRTWYKVH